METTIFNQAGFLEADTILLYVDNRPMLKEHWWPPVARLARERATHKRKEVWHVDLVLNCEASGTETLHPTWAATPFLLCGCVCGVGKIGS